MADYVISMDMLGSKELKAALDNSSRVAKKAMADALNKAALELAAHLAELPTPHKTGDLQGSFSHPTLATSVNLAATVGTNKEYARAQEYGTIGMTIHSRSRLGKAFTYIGTIKPKFYMKQGMDWIKPKLSDHLEFAAKKIVSYLAGKESA